jgi:hypothetical protein
VIYLEDDDTYVFPQHVAIIKGTYDEGKCVLFTTGQNALEGHVLNLSAKEVADAVDQELNPYDDGEFEEEEE